MNYRRVDGFAVVCTLIAAFVGSQIPMQNANSGRVLSKRRDYIVAQAIGTMAGALIGAAIGIAVDIAINGVPRKQDWRLSLRTFVFLVSALCVFAIGLKSFLEAVRIEP